VPLSYLMNRLGVTKDPEDFEEGMPMQSNWTALLAAPAGSRVRDTNVPTMDSHHYTSFSN
jgi:hypothetical protein